MCSERRGPLLGTRPGCSMTYAPYSYFVARHKAHSVVHCVMESAFAVLPFIKGGE